MPRISDFWSCNVPGGFQSQRFSSMACFLPALREAAPRLTRHLFECSSHRPLSLQQHASRFRKQSILQGPARLHRSFNLSTRHAVETTVAIKPSTVVSSTVKDSTSKSSAYDGRKTRARFFPRTSERAVAYWLLGSAASVFGIVIFGGLTRLTESGYVTKAMVLSDANRM